MKSRLVVLTMLVLGMLLSTAGAGLAVSSVTGNAAQDQYATPSPTGGGGVLGDQDSGAGEQPSTDNGSPSPSGGEEGADVQPSRQVEAGANENNLPFTGFAAIPVLLGGIALLSAGLVLRRRTGDER